MYRDFEVAMGALTNTLVVIFLICTVFMFIAKKVEQARNRKARKEIFDGQFIPRIEFEKNWIRNEIDENGIVRKKGYKHTSCNGCYVIFVYHQPIEQCGCQSYDDVYVGQSLDIHHRVHMHFRGKGNSRVAFAIRRGKFLYVRFLPCVAKDMNKMEKRYIKALAATNSYNKTRGGGKRRY